MPIGSNLSRALASLVLLLVFSPRPATAGEPARVTPEVSALTPYGNWGSSFERWSPTRPHGFVLGGLSFLGVDLPGGTGWTLTGGGEMPMSDGAWTLVPRVSLSGAGTDYSGTLFLGRATLDGRLTNERGGILYHTEAGVGVGLVDRPIQVWDSYLEPPRVQQTTKGAFVFQFVQGMRSDPERGNGFVIEFLFAIGSGHDSISALELAAGVGF